MSLFLETVDTIGDGFGFSHFDSTHFMWLVATVLILFANVIAFRNLKEKGRALWKKIVAILLVVDELFKMAILFIGGNYSAGYLPLHLCSINIFLIALHAWKPSKILDNFLYTVCIPGTLAALLFPTWTSLPVLNAMHLHSFTVHILLLLYPAVLSICGDIKPDIRYLPKALGLLVVMAIPIYIVNVLLDTNFMFLMYADEGNPLYLFQQMWGSHLLGFPVITAGVLLVMYGPIIIYNAIKKKTTS